MSSYQVKLAAFDAAAAEDVKMPNVPFIYGKLAPLLANDYDAAIIWNNLEYMRGHWAELGTKQTDAERTAFKAICKAKYAK